MMKIKKPLITRIVGNGLKPFPTLIAIVFIFTGTGYSASEPLTLRPALQFSDTGREAIEEGRKTPNTTISEEQEFILQDLTCKAKKGWHARPSQFLMDFLVPILEQTGLVVDISNDQGETAVMGEAARALELFKKQELFDNLSVFDLNIVECVFEIDPEMWSFNQTAYYGIRARIKHKLILSFFELGIGLKQNYSIRVSGKAQKAKLQQMAELVKDYMKAIEIADNKNNDMTTILKMRKIFHDFREKIYEQFSVPIKQKNFPPAAPFGAGEATNAESISDSCIKAPRSCL